MSPARIVLRRAQHRDQQGMTLIETMLGLSLSMMLILPMLAWAQLAFAQQASTVERNVRGSTLGILRTYFSDDVAGADFAAVDPDELIDCAGGAGVKGQLIAVLGDGDRRIVYSVAPEDEGTDGLWRRTCDKPGSDTTSSTLLIGDVLAKVTDVSCDSTATSVDSANAKPNCGRLTLRVTTADLKQTSITATRRAVGAFVEPPIAVIGAEPTTGTRPLVVKFNSSRSEDPKGGKLTSSWDFGDGTTATDETVKHEYSKVGTFDVTLTVTDETGRSSSTTTQIVVIDNRPVAVIAEPKDGTQTFRGERIQFSAKGSNDDLDAEFGGRVVSYLWDFGDGTTSADPVPIKAYSTLSPPGGYRVALTVTDDSGQQGITTIAVQVLNRVPTVAIAATPTGGAAPLTVEFAALVSDEATMSPPPAVTYQWDFGNGTTSIDAIPKPVTYDLTGDYTAVLTVTDDQGVTASDRIEINVGSVALAPPTGLRGTNSGKDGRDNRFIEFAWDRLDGATRYQVYVSCQRCNEVASAMESGTTLRINGLRKPATKYDAWIRAQFADGSWGPWSVPIEVKS